MQDQSLAYKRIEYTKPPLIMRIDTSRGVLYIGETKYGLTILRMCRIPFKYIDNEYGTREFDPKDVSPNLKRRAGDIKQKAPVFLSVLMSDILIEDESGVILWQIKNLPDRVLEAARELKPIDITCGYKGGS